jgi:hypothetical protein
VAVNHHCAHRYFSGIKGRLRLFQGFFHNDTHDTSPYRYYAGR